jgi:hypothetical protein
MYEKIFRMKFLPPGRGLWAMGTPITEERGLYAALNNCAFVSTGIPPGGDPTEPFTFLMDAAMLGVVAWLLGGFHVQGFVPALGGSLVVSLVFLALDSLDSKLALLDYTTHE